MVKKHIRFDWAAKKLLRAKANFDILEEIGRASCRERVLMPV